MRRIGMLMMCAACSAGIVLAQETPRPLEAQKPPLLSAEIVGALDQELSGETAKRNLEGITRFHRIRGSRGFHDAAELVAERARAYGLTGVANPHLPRRRKDFLRHAALASALGRRFRRALGNARGRRQVESCRPAGKF